MSPDPPKEMIRYLCLSFLITALLAWLFWFLKADVFRPLLIDPFQDLDQITNTHVLPVGNPCDDHAQGVTTVPRRSLAVQVKQLQISLVDLLEFGSDLIQCPRQ